MVLAAKKSSPIGQKLPRKPSNGGLWAALSLAWELGYTIAIPIVIFALLGRFLDKKFDSSPWLLLLGIFFALLISGFVVTKKALKIIAAAAPAPPKTDLRNNQPSSKNNLWIYH